MTYKFSLLAASAAMMISLAGCGSSSPDPAPQPTVVDQTRGGAGGDANGGTAAAAAGEGWGTLKGVFVYNGDPPSLKPLDTGGKDGQVCDQHPIPDETLVVNPQSKGIKNIVIFARRVSRVHEDAKAPPEKEAVFDQKECVFLTHVMPVRVGQPVVVKNSDPIGHNTNIQALGDSKGSQNFLLAANGQAEHGFSRPQTSPVPVSCNIHPWMKAYIIPRNDPYVAVTKEDGSFEIANLPAGEEIEFQVWHEKTPNGLEAKPQWAKGRFKVKIPKDGEHDLGEGKPIAVDPSAFQ
jgi:plastocyanin